MARQTDIRLRRSAVSGSVPTTSNLNLGELALNTADGKVYMKKSVGGTDTVVEVGSGSGISASFIAYEYTATANQTTFSGSDNNSNTLAYNTGTPPSVQVFMNGILLDEGSSQDYTGTNGTSVVLGTATDSNDTVIITAFRGALSAGLDSADVLSISGGGGGTDSATVLGLSGELKSNMFRINPQSLSINTTIDSAENAHVAGPISFDSGVTLTINGNLVIS